MTDGTITPEESAPPGPWIEEDLSPAEILAWHLEAGVDEAIGEEPCNFFDRPGPATKVEETKVTAPRPATPAATAPPSAPPAKALPGQAKALADAVHAAQAASTVAELRSFLEAYDGCALKRSATNLVFYDGNPEANLLLIGEGPGAEEDRQGLPFVGPSGRLLDKMLESIGLDRSRVLISNTVFWRPPGNRTPTLGEVALCQPFVERLIELVDPRVIVALGKPAANSLLGRADSLSKLRGRWFDYQTPGLSRPAPLTALYHPAYLLRTPAQKRLAWRDLLSIRQKLLETP